jgi:hypothetical protein
MLGLVRCEQIPSDHHRRCKNEKGIHMDEDVKSASVEETADSTSSVEEPQTTDTQETPVVSDDTERVSKAVPYERFKEVNDQVKELKDMVAAMSQPQQRQEVQEDYPDLDPDSAKAVQRQARQVYEQQEQARFESRYAKDFDKDPLLKGAFLVEVQNKMAKGEYIDRETVLEQAKQTLEERLNSRSQVAKEAGVKEGQDIAKTKQQLAAVGETAKQPEVDPDKMTASELAKHMNIPRVN